MLALNTGMRYNEIRLLRWRQLDFAARMLTVGKSKSPTGTGRAIPLNSRILSVLEMWAARFPGRQPAHFVFASEKYGAAGQTDTFGFTAGLVIYDKDPTRPIGDWKEAWEKAKQRAGAILGGKAEEEESEPLQCRFHDLRHTAVTRLLEAGIPYPVVASIMGWSAATAIRMSKRYGHIGNQALRAAADVLGGVETPTESLKKSPKSSEVENGFIQ
jgi:integrase